MLVGDGNAGKFYALEVLRLSSMVSMVSLATFFMRCGRIDLFRDRTDVYATDCLLGLLTTAVSCVQGKLHAVSGAESFLQALQVVADGIG